MRVELQRYIQAQIDSLEGWTDSQRGIAMAQLVLDIEPTRELVCVEIGVFGGRSMIPQAIALAERGSGVIYGMDPWKADPAMEGENEANQNYWKEMDYERIHQGVMRAIWRLGLDRHAVILRSRSQDCYRLFRDIDVLTIDGNHSEEASCRDVRNYLPRVVSGGYIWCDDLDWEVTPGKPSLAKARAMLEKECAVITDNGHYALFRKK